jgi:hypothetical protein
VVTEQNPAGVAILRPPSGTVHLGKNFNIKGTLIVEGNLVLDDQGLKVEPLAGMPAIVTTGYLKSAKDAGGDVGGLVYLGQGVSGASSDKPGKLVIIGALVCPNQQAIVFPTSADVSITYDVEKVSLADIASGGSSVALAVLDWQETTE